MNTRRIAVRGIIFKDGKMLAQQTHPGKGEEVRNYWCTPGGGLEAGESLHEGLHREMIEETGIAPQIGKLLFVQQYGNPTEQEFLEFFFHIENAQDYEEIDLTATSHGELEIARVDFIDPKKHNLLPAFLQTIAVDKHVTTHLPILIYNELFSKAE
jgi:8-oxo-dGTP pyrophosphatase MutT (NUDIX family)